MENKTGKYFKYAIGEIVLVVIGILIALSINNWNESEKLRSKEKELLITTYKYLQQDTIQLRSEHKSFQKIIDYGLFIKQKFKENTPYQKKLDTAFVLISQGYVSEANYTPYTRLEDVGLEIIKNDSIRTLIAKYYEASKRSKYIEDYFENSKFYRQKIYPKYFKAYKHGSYAIPKNYKALKTNSEFNIALDYSINDAYFFRRISALKKSQAVALLNLIKKEIN